MESYVHGSKIIKKLLERPESLDIDGHYDHLSDEEQMVAIVDKYLKKYVSVYEPAPDWNDWEAFLRHWEGDMSIHPVVRERIMRKLFNIKR